jgi:hypothetical protein
MERTHVEQMRAALAEADDCRTDLAAIVQALGLVWTCEWRAVPLELALKARTLAKGMHENLVRAQELAEQVADDAAAMQP